MAHWRTVPSTLDQLISATMISPRLQKAGIMLLMVEKALRIDDSVFSPQVRGNVLFELQVDVESTAEAWSRAGSNAVGAYRLDCGVDESLVSG